MKRQYAKHLIPVVCLIAATCVTMAYSGKKNSAVAIPGGKEIRTKNGIVSLSGRLTQEKIIAGGDGTVAMSLTLKADEVNDPKESDSKRNMDMVIVLDRSGSMEGAKLTDAKLAASDLLAELSEKDRFALVTYSDAVRRYSGLMNVTAANRERLTAMIHSVHAGGSTDLGAGLKDGIELVLHSPKVGNIGRVILISDGLANRGITGISELAVMASVAAEKEFAISAVGVGSDFNEQLMTAIADRGAGTYYYLENPNAFAAMFRKEFHNGRNAAVGALEIRVPLGSGISLVNASGFPIEMKDDVAVFHPGDLLSGQTRNLFLTFRVPTTEGNYEIKGIEARYLLKGETYGAALSEPFGIACVKDRQAVFGSYDKKLWERKVIQDDYNKLKEDVAASIGSGKKDEAMTRIRDYESKQQAVNQVLKSEEVAKNLETDVRQLSESVKDTFTGSAPEVRAKQNKAAKSLQYEGYQERRSKQ